MAGTSAAQNVGQAEQPKAEQQGAQRVYADGKSGTLLVCTEAQTGQENTYRCKPARKPSVGDRVWRWVFRAARDPIAIFTFALLAVGVWQVGIAQRTAHRQLRAYLHLFPGGITDQDPEAGFKVEARPNIINKGQTPAYDVRYQATVRALPLHLPETFNFNAHHEASVASVTLGPDQTSWLVATADGFLSPGELAQAKGSGPLYLRVYGTVWYRDAFGKRHHTNFNWVLVWRGSDVAWMMQREHQEAD